MANLGVLSWNRRWIFLTHTKSNLHQPSLVGWQTAPDHMYKLIFSNHYSPTHLKQYFTDKQEMVITNAYQVQSSPNFTCWMIVSPWTDEYIISLPSPSHLKPNFIVKQEVIIHLTYQVQYQFVPNLTCCMTVSSWTDVQANTLSLPAYKSKSPCINMYV